MHPRPLQQRPGRRLAILGLCPGLVVHQPGQHGVHARDLVAQSHQQLLGGAVLAVVLDFALVHGAADGIVIYAPADVTAVAWVLCHHYHTFIGIQGKAHRQFSDWHAVFLHPGQ
ncbi:hypothetical protein D3C76_1148970 [compost metagenome]